MEKINQIQVLPSGLLGTISREIGWGQTVKKVNGGGGGGGGERWGGGGGGGGICFACNVCMARYKITGLFS